VDCDAWLCPELDDEEVCPVWDDEALFGVLAVTELGRIALHGEKKAGIKKAIKKTAVNSERLRASGNNSLNPST
jgi:hypothetical protein